jgi:hypothetical protein
MAARYLLELQCYPNELLSTLPKMGLLVHGFSLVVNRLLMQKWVPLFWYQHIGKRLMTFL